MSKVPSRGPIGQKRGKPKSNPAYMAKVAELPCCICGARPVEVHHCISGRFSQAKESDLDTIPLCVNHHRGPDGIHTSKRIWEALNGPDTGFIGPTRAAIETITMQG